LTAKKVLVTPLDWGLGHATRCIPVISELQRQRCDVTIAGSGDSLALLKGEFPGLPFIELPGYQPRYPRNGSMVTAMVRQLPHFMRVIAAEHRALERIVQNEKIDLVISDNRYGCWSDRTYSVFITHQSNIMMPARFGILQPLVRRVTRHFMNRFHACWIPDRPDAPSLAEDLISFGKIGVKSEVQYIGWLSRFENSRPGRMARYEVLAVFSGPEPQRSLFERTVLPQLRESGLRYLAVRGLPSDKSPLADDSVVNFMASEELRASIEASDLVIARSGYSTVMDMNALGGKVVFVPTPGQTEQEYLASRLMKKRIAYATPQQAFDLAGAIRESKNYTGFQGAGKNDLLPGVIRKTINALPRPQAEKINAKPG
jgi:predicted glycosyltransferase